MSFLDKLSDNKVKVLLGLGGVALLGAIGFLYNNYNKQEETSQEHQHQEQQKQQDIDLQIQKLKSQINLADPSFEDIKKILAFSLQVSKKQIFKFSKNFKKDRKKYNKQKRNQNLDQYLRMVSQGLMQIQQLGMVMQQQVLTKIGINEMHFAKYQRQLGPFLQQQMMSQGVGSQSKPLSLEQVKKAINLQIEYMETQGDEMVEKLVNTCSGWNNQQKSMVPTLISVYIADEVFQQHPEIDEEQLQGAQMRFQNQLQNEMYRLQEVMAPLMTKLTQGLGFGQMGGYGGMGGMGGMDMGMGGQGPTMQQLEQLRMQDPQAFEQLMYMMSQGMQ